MSVQDLLAAATIRAFAGPARPVVRVEAGGPSARLRREPLGSDACDLAVYEAHMSRCQRRDVLGVVRGEHDRAPLDQEFGQ